MKNISLLLLCAACAAACAFAEPVVPGEYTDPTNLRKEAENGSGDWYVAPDHLKFPYISTYYVEPTFEDCTFDDCQFGGLQTASVKFRRCTFAGGGVGSGYWTNPSSISCEDCTFDATGGHWIRFGAYATGKFRFDRCRIGSSNGSCGQFVDLFDWRSSSGDQWPGSIEFRNCVVGEGVAALVGCSTMSANGYLRPGNDPTKKIDCIFEGNTLAPGAIEKAELPHRR